MGLKPEQALGGLRFSLSRYNTEAEIDEVLNILPRLVERIRAAA
jgi:cysteine desulfurase